MPKGSKRKSLYHGLLVVDKPQGLTSQDVVNVVRRAAGTRRVGHTGTLDPLATGLLIILLGEGTKLSEYLIHMDKEYEGTMQLGVMSNTYDSEGEIIPGPGGALPELEVLQKLAKEKLSGDIEQVPPPFSAVKIKGKKLYEYARAGEEVKADARSVRVKEYEILDLQGDTAKFRVSCTSGTYVRSLVHDLGQLAGCGALVTSLRRTKIEDFSLEESVELETVRESTPEKFADFVAPMMDAMTNWPLYHVSAEGVSWLKRGQAIPMALAELDRDSHPGKADDLVYLCPLGRDALAVARVMPAPPSRPPAELRRHVGLWFQPVKLLASDEE